MLSAMTLDDAVMWLNDRCGKGVAVWISADDDRLVLSTEGELRHATDANGAADPSLKDCYDVGHIRVFLAQGNVGVIEYTDDAVRVFMTDRPRIATWPNDDSRLLVQLDERGILHVVEQKDPPV